MDMAKFYAWRYQTAITALAIAARKPVGRDEERPRGVDVESCYDVFEILVEDGLATSHPGGWFQITAKGRQEAKTSAAAGRKLLGELLKENERLVRKYVGRQRRRSAQFTEEEDLFQAGCLGFVRTLERFDPSRFSSKGLGKSFTNYLEAWVRRFVQWDMTDQMPIKRPDGFGMPYKLHLKAEDIHARTGRPATAEELGVTEKQLGEWRTSSLVVYSNEKYGTAASIEETDELQVMNATFAAKLQSRFGEASDSSLSPEGTYASAQEDDRIKRALSQLGDTKRRIVELTLEGKGTRAIAKELGLTDEGVRISRERASADLRELLSEDEE